MIDKRAYAVLETVNRLKGGRFGDLVAEVPNRRTLSRKLSYLRERGLLELDDHEYRLTAKGLEVFEALRNAVKAVGRVELSASNLERIPHAVLAPVLGRYVNILYQHFEHRLLGALVFGSLARGAWTRDSDVDLLLVVEGWDEPLSERLRRLWALRKLLRETPQYREAMNRGYVPVLQHYPLNDAEARQFHRIYLDASVEGIILYEKDGFLSQLMEKVRAKLRAAGVTRLLIPGKGHYWMLGERFTFEGL